MSKELFTDYFNKNFWQGKESKSGPGSDHEQTKFLVPELSQLLRDLKIKTILDVPCGDFNWMRNVNLSGINYHGGDIVENVIASNSRKYSRGNISFSVIDIVKDSLPKVDLLIVRDCFVHLPEKDILKALSNIKKSKSKYLLMTNFAWESFDNNYDIEVGQWRRLNFTQHPYAFKYPERMIIEGNVQSNDRDKTMSLWKVEDVPDYD